MSGGDTVPSVGFTALYINLNGEWTADECQPEYVEIARWDGIDPVCVGDLVTLHGVGAEMVTARVTSLRWGVQRGDRVRSLELYGSLTRFDGGEGTFYPTDVRRVARAQLSASGHDAESIDDVLAHPVSLREFEAQS